MKNAVLLLLLTLAATPFSQSGGDESASGGRVRADKPTVYLEHVCQDKKRVYLRMHNNTVWHISVVTDDLYYPSETPIRLRNGIGTYAAPNNREVSLQYRVEKWALPSEHVEVPEVAYPDNGFSSWIASRDSILFSVPVGYLRKDLQVSVSFNYEWEITKKGHTINDAEHRVSFRGLDLSAPKPSACETSAHLR